MSVKVQTYPLRLPLSLKRAVEDLSEQDGTSINQFVVTAVAEKVASMHTAAFFEDRKARTKHPETRAVFRRILRRKGGEPPRAGDEIDPVPARRSR